MEKHIIDEANRCLQCKNPRCVKGCPVGTPINQIIRMLLNGDILESGQTLFNNNPLSVICSLVCPHERQCEGHCVLNAKQQPVKFSNIEHYISEYYLNFIKPTNNINHDKKVAIIGSGPAGITISIILASMGYDVTIFEAHDKIGGVLRYGIPEFRLPKVILERLKEKILAMKIKIRPNTLIGTVLTIDDLFRDGFKAVFIGTGVWKPRTLGIEGESLGHVHYAIDYLKSPEEYNLGNRLCIIGAGNVAMDVARTAKRNGVQEVFILYRGGFDTMTAEKSEVQLAKIEGVKFELFKTPVKITDEGLYYNNTEEYLDENGEKQYVITDKTPYLFNADSVIVSISQGPRNIMVNTTTGINVNEKGLISTNELGETTREGIFASGDVVTGAKTVVEAVRVSKNVALSIDEYVTKKYFSEENPYK